MLTTLVSILLSIFGALRAAPLYYSRILTLGNTLLASLGDGTVLPTIDSLSATNARTPVRVLRLPPSLVRLTLPGAPPSHLVGPLLALLAAVITITVVLSGFIWHLRTVALVLNSADTSINAGDPEKILYTIIDFSGVTYNGNVLTSDIELAGLFGGSTVLDPSLPFDTHIPSTPIFKFEAPAASPQCTVGREDHENVTLASSESTSSLLPPTPPPTPVSTPSSTTIDLVAALVELTSAIEEDLDEEDTWDTWTNRRRRRPPTRAPPSDPRAWRSRSLSVFATSRTSRPLFSPVQRPLRPLPTRTRTNRSVASYNKFSVLEMLDAEE